MVKNSAHDIHAHLFILLHILPKIKITSGKIIVGIGGNVNIPYGTICNVVDGYIMYKNKIVYACRSQNGKDCFWGYDKNNPDEEIKRQELASELYKYSSK